MDPMNRRSMIAGLGATGLALGLGRNAFAQGTGGSHQGTYGTSAIASQCIDACTSCHNVCVGATQHCLKVGGDHVKAEHLRLLQACAEICTVAADFMLSSSEFDKKLCALCEEVCRRCADSCDQFSDEPMKRCAKECRDCADACRRFIQS